MIFSQQSYSVLLVSDSARMNQAVTELLPAASYDPIRIVPSVSAARRAALERVYDLVILNTPLPDDFGTAFAAAQSGNRQTVVLMLVPAALQEELQSQVADRGVFTLAKPTTRQALATALQWMTVVRERLRRVEETGRTVEERMRDIHLVNRAKCLLIEQRGMSEAEAHRYLEQEAMNRCVPKRAVAEELIRAQGQSPAKNPAKDETPYGFFCSPMV